jgi:hypothetical protein
MTLSAFLGRCVGIKSVGTSCQTTAVAVEVKEVDSTRGSIEALFGVVLTGSTFGAALLTKIKNVGVNELTSGTGGTASIGSNVFIVRCFGGGRGSVGVDSDSSDILTRLTEGQSKVGAGGTTFSALSTSVIRGSLIVASCTILDTKVALKVDFGSEVGESARGAFFGVINTSFAIGITLDTSKGGGIGIGAIETGV